MTNTSLAIRKKRSFFSGIGILLVRYRWISILPVVIYLLFFFIIPLSRSLFSSFWDPSFTLKHYRHFFTEPVYVKVIMNSFKIAFTVTIFSLLLGYPYAYLLSSVSEPLANKLLIFILLPFWIGMVHIMLPYMVLSLYAVMKGIDRDLLKAAQNLGANRFSTFVWVFLPLSLPGIAGGCLMVFIMAIGYFITPALLGGAKDTMIAQLIEKNVTLMLNWGFAFAASFVLLFFTVVILIVYNRFLGLDRLWGGVD
jgi:ABC-type spermidine/putrescine transport system permease subunit I